MLTDRQLADITADVAAALDNQAADTPLRLMARHARYLLDEVERLKQEQAGMTAAEWITQRQRMMEE
jgi:hypothetical protein